MPIYQHTYRSYEGEVRRRFRWMIMLEQELRILFKSRIFITMLLFGLLHVILRLLQLVAYDVIVQDPNNPLTSILSQVQAIVVDENTFLDFIRYQGLLVFIALLFAGAGMICNDFNNNLMEVYFSKPLSWRDYVLGKVLTLISIGALLTALPATVLVLLHNLLLPGVDTISKSLPWLVGIAGFSVVMVVPCALMVLACSSLMKSQNLAAVTVFMVLLADYTLGALLAEFLRDHRFAMAAFPLAQNQLGEILFGVRPSFDAHWGFPLFFITLVCLWAAWVICRRARRAEIPA